MAIEATGRLAIIEVKLSRNSEARRAVVAQILSYAAFLRGMELATLETDILGQHLAKRERKSIAEAAGQLIQTGYFDPTSFNTALQGNLATGAFRLIVVLDSAPAELVRVIGYLESVAPELTLDLITVTKYTVGSEDVLVPQRVEPTREQTVAVTTTARPGQGPKDGTGEFLAAIASVGGARRQRLDELVAWAEQLKTDGLCQLSSYRSPRGDSSLLPRMADEGVGFVTIWSSGAFTPWRSVFERRAPTSLQLLDVVTPKPIGKGHNVEASPEVLRLVRRAYREAAHQLDPDE